jgi:uncharacterized membrane protein
MLFGVSLITGDEMWAATSVLGGPIDSIVFTLRFDLHPPVYYSIIDLWATISKSDLWLRSSSMAIHSALVASTYYITGKLYNKKVSVIATVLILVSPLLLEYSNQLRMYSLISLLSIWIFYFAYNINDNGFSRKSAFLLFGLELLLVFTHAIGILFVFFHYMYGVMAKNPIHRLDFIYKWSLFHILVFCLSVPVILNSWVRSVEHAVAPDIDNILNVISITNIKIIGLGPVYSFAISLLVLVILLFYKKTRSIAICYIVLPIAVFSLISYAIKPLWLARNFAFAIPLIVIAQSIVINKIFGANSRSKIYLYACVLLIAVSHLSVYFQYYNNKQDGNHLSDLSAYLKDAILDKGKTCVVSTNTLHTFWSLLRYNVAIEWGHPLDIQPPLTDKWNKIISKLPPKAVQSLQLMPDTNFYEGDKLIITSGWSERCRGDDVGRVLVIDERNKIEELDIKSNIVETFGQYTVHQVINSN